MKVKLFIFFVGLVSLSLAKNVDRGKIKRRFPRRFISTTTSSDCSLADECKPAHTGFSEPIAYLDHIPKRQIFSNLEFVKRRKENDDYGNGDDNADGSDNEDEDEDVNKNKKNSNSAKSKHKNSDYREDSNEITSRKGHTNFKVNFIANSTNNNFGYSNNNFKVKGNNNNNGNNDNDNDYNQSNDINDAVITEGPFTGTGIPYSPAEGFCSSKTYTDNDLVVALNKQQYGEEQISGLCGKCIEITGDIGKMVFTIVDACDDCKYGGIEIAQNIYGQLISEEYSGDITWDFVDCQN